MLGLAGCNCPPSAGASLDGGTMSKKKPNIDAWLKTATRLPARHCASCEEPYASAISEVLGEMASGRVGRNVTFSGLHRFLSDPENFDPPFPLGVEALRAHIRAHESKLYAEWVSRGR